MKTRAGFVSNSSSSSFIIGLARVTDEQKLRAYLKRNDIETLVRIYSEEDFHRRECKSDTSITIESFNGHTVQVQKGTKSNQKYILIDIYNNEGDLAFCHGDDGYCDYDINLDFLSSDQQRLFAIDEKEAGIEDLHITFGAGR